MRNCLHPDSHLGQEGGRATVIPQTLAGEVCGVQRRGEGGSEVGEGEGERRSEGQSEGGRGLEERGRDGRRDGKKDGP